MSKDAAQYILDFFQAYPEETIYDNVEEVNARLTTMRDCVVALRGAAIAAQSVQQLRDVHVLEVEFNGVYTMLRQRQAQKALSNGIQLAASMPDAHDPKAWRK